MKGVLILGPTGTGKTPLGQHLAQAGLWGESCAHFDFGEALRNAEDGGLLTEGEMAVVRRVLTEGSLLEDSEFPIAKKLLAGFLEKHDLPAGGRVILNGLPRHEGQAEAVSDIVTVKCVVQLACTADVIHARIRTNSGGDRTERTDDSTGEIEKKLKIYEARTFPLVEYYRNKGVVVRVIEVGVETTPTDVIRLLEG